MSTFQIGSQTAKGGFANERAIAKKFNAWKKDIQAQLWLQFKINPCELFQLA